MQKLLDLDSVVVYTQYVVSTDCFEYICAWYFRGDPTRFNSSKCTVTNAWAQHSPIKVADWMAEQFYQEIVAKEKEYEQKQK